MVGHCAISKVGLNLLKANRYDDEKIIYIKKKCAVRRSRYGWEETKEIAIECNYRLLEIMTCAASTFLSFSSFFVLNFLFWSTTKPIIIVIIKIFSLIILLIKTRIDIILKRNLGHADSFSKELLWIIFNPCYNNKPQTCWLIAGNEKPPTGITFNYTGSSLKNLLSFSLELDASLHRSFRRR